MRKFSGLNSYQVQAEIKTPTMDKPSKVSIRFVDRNKSTAEPKARVEIARRADVALEYVTITEIKCL